jgi:hypothetical protein
MFNRIKIINYLICLSFLSISFRHEITSICLYLTVLFSLFEIFKNKINVFKVKNSVILFFISYFIIEIFGLIHTNNFYFAIKDIESKILFVVACLILIGNNTQGFNINKFFKFYIAGIFLNLLFLIVFGIIEFIKHNNFPKYDSFSFLMHPTYYAVNLLIAIIIIFVTHNLFNNKFIRIFLFLFFSLGIILTDSKAGILCYIFILITITIRYILILNFKLKLIVFILGIFFSLISYIYLPKSRITELFDTLQTTTLYNNYNGVYNSTETRIIIWRLTRVVINNNLVFGTGTGDIKDELNNQYEKTNFIYGSDLKYNCHNQFLQIIATFGIIFGFPLILILFKILHDTIKNKNMLFSVILLIFIINFLFESFLETKAGVETFVLFCIIIGSTLNQNRNLNFSSI